MSLATVLLGYLG